MIELHEIVHELQELAHKHPTESKLKKLITYYEDKIDELLYEDDFSNDVFV